LILSIVVAGCSKSEAPLPSKPAPSATALPVAAPTAARAPVAITSPSPQTSPQQPVAGVPAPEPDNYEWNLAEKAEDEEFEIDADATSYYMPVYNTVYFKAKALNGTPPFTFTWHFGDGSPPMTGELLQHTFTEIGRRDVWVHGTDATGATSSVQLGLLVAPVQEYIEKLQRDPKEYEGWGPYATPTPTR
jgi:hypothetical protein